MKKMRKIINAMAVAGAVVLMLMVCYLPLRDSIRELRRENVSLGNEIATETVEGRLEEEISYSTEKDGSAAGQKDENTDGAAKDVVAGKQSGMPKVVFQVENGGIDIEVSLWRSSDGSCYVFLPGFVDEKLANREVQSSISLASIEGNGSLQIGSQILHGGDVLSGLEWEAAYPMTIYDRQEQILVEAPLIFLHSSQLPVIVVETESGSMEKVEADKNAEERGTVKVWDENGTALYQGKAQSIGARGNSTFGLLKKPFQFKLEENVDLFGFGEADSWNLLADGYDETGLRNHITLEMAKALEMEYVPDGRMVDLYCNGEYYGVYYLSEKVEIGESRVAIEDLEEKTELAYTKEQLESLNVIEAEDGSMKWTEIGYAEADLTGGYLLERELEDRYSQDSSGFVTKQGDIYALKSPQYASQEQVEYIAGIVQELEDALEEKDGKNPDTGKHYTQLLDLDSFVKKYLVEEVTKNYDGGVTSSFFYKPNDAQSTKLFAGPVWDYDVAFGNCNLNKIASNPTGVTMLDDHMWGTKIFVKLYEQEEFYARTVELYEEKIVPYLNQLLENGIDELSQQTRQSRILNDIRWEDLSNRYQYYEEYENNIRYLKYFIEARRDYLNEVWLEGAVYHTVTFEVDGLAWKRYYVKDGELLQKEPVPSRYSSLFLGWFIKGSGVPFDEYKPVYEDITYYASFQEMPVEEVKVVPEGFGE